MKNFIYLLLVFNCLFGGHSAFAQRIDIDIDTVPNQVIVLFKPSTTKETIDELAKTIGVIAIDMVPCYPGLFLWTLSDGNVGHRDALGRAEASSSPNYITKGDENTLSENKPCVNNVMNQCGITGRKKVKVGFIDTGLDGFNHAGVFSSANHEALLNPFRNNIEGENLISGILNDRNAQDDHIIGHGTHVFGIAAKIIQSYGIQSSVDFRVYKALDSKGSGTLFNIMKAIGSAICDDVNILNISANWREWRTEKLSPIEEIINFAGQKGMLIVASAGNNGVNVDVAGDVKFCPAAYTSPNLIIVNAETCTGNLANFSNLGLSSVDISAPGVDISSILIGMNQTGTLSGTSMAASVITAEATILAALNPPNNPFDFTAIKQAILNNVIYRPYGRSPNFCTAITAISSPNVNIIQPNCSIRTGTITITVTSATAGTTYSFDNGATYQSSPTKSGLQSGMYIMRVKKDVCVSFPTSVTIDAAPVVPTAPTATVLQPTCLLQTGTITITPPTGLTYSFDNGNNYQNSPTKSGLTPATYQIKVKNAAGCISSPVSVVVNPIPVVTAPAATVLQPTCLLQTGTITITSPTGLTYSFDNGAFVTSNVKSGLTSATYQIKVKNAAGCISSPVSVVVNPVPIVATPTWTVTQPTCVLPTGTITIAVATGLTYSFDNGATFIATNTKSGLAPNTYLIRVKNTAGCISSAINVVVNPVPVAAMPTWTIVQPTCLLPTGTITIALTSGLTYSFDNGATFITANTKSGLVPNTYLIKVKNAASCISSVTNVTVGPIPVVIAPTATVLQPTCQVQTGTITIAPTTGLTYSFDNGTTFTTANVKSGLIPAAYQIKVKNAVGCISSATNIVVNPVPVIVTPATTVTQPTCLLLTGTITIAPTTGLTYSFDNGATFITANTKSSLVPNTYLIKVKNAAGCISSAISVVVNPIPVVATPTWTIVQPTCLLPTGTITIAATTGLTYSFDDGATFIATNTKSGLVPNTYLIRVKNTAGCISSAISVVVNPIPVAATQTWTVVHPTCLLPTGTITIATATGLTYSFDNGTTFIAANTKSGLVPNTYLIRVKKCGGLYFKCNKCGG